MAIPSDKRDMVRALRKDGATDVQIQYFLETGCSPFAPPPRVPGLPSPSEPQEPLAQPDVAPEVTAEEVSDYGDPERL